MEKKIKKKISKKYLSKFEVMKITSDISLIDKLEEEGFINDERFTIAFIHDKTKFNNYGKYKIKILLRQKGISEEIINKYIETINEDEIIERIKKKNPKNLEYKLYRNGIKKENY